MGKENKHTGLLTISNTLGVIVVKCGKEIVASFDPSKEKYAQLIVDAVNNYAGLVEALSEIISVQDKFTGIGLQKEKAGERMPGFDDYFAWLFPVIEKYKQALNDARNGGSND